MRFILPERLLGQRHKPVGTRGNLMRKQHLTFPVLRSFIHAFAGLLVLCSFPLFAHGPFNTGELQYSVTVTDSDGKPLKDAVVTFNNITTRFSHRHTSDSNGKTPAFYANPGDDIHLTASLQGWSYNDLDFVARESKRFYFKGNKSEANVKVTVHVLDSEGAPISGARVDFTNMATGNTGWRIVDEKGVAVYWVNPGTSLRMVPQAPGYQFDPPGVAKVGTEHRDVYLKAKNVASAGTSGSGGAIYTGWHDESAVELKQRISRGCKQNHSKDKYEVITYEIKKRTGELRARFICK